MNLSANLECKFCGKIILYGLIMKWFFCTFFSALLHKMYLSLTFSFSHTHTHSFSTVTRCLSLCSLWVLPSSHLANGRPFMRRGDSLFYQWEHVCERMVTTRRGWNVLCSNMLYFPTVTRTESLSLSILLQPILSFQFHACGLKRLVRYSDE